MGLRSPRQPVMLAALLPEAQGSFPRHHGDRRQRFSHLRRTTAASSPFQLVCGVYAWLSVLLLSTQQLPTEAAKFLSTPALHFRLAPPTDFSEDLIAEGNGVTIDGESDRAYITTLQGKVLVVSLKSNGVNVTQSSTVLFATPSVTTGSTPPVGVSRGVLYGAYVVFAVLDVDSSLETVTSRILVVPTNKTAEDKSESSVWTINLTGVVKGPILINPEGHLFVVHQDDAAGDGSFVGKLSIFDLSNIPTGVVEVASLPSDNSAGALGPPARRRVMLDDGSEADWIVMGENAANGESSIGNLYAVRFDPASATAQWHILSSAVGGSTAKAPALSADGTTIVLGIYQSTVLAWVNNADIRDILQYSTEEGQTDIEHDMASFLSFTSDKKTVIATEPVLMGKSHVLVPDRDYDLVALNLDKGGQEDWRITTLSGHTATPLVLQDGSGEWVVFDLTREGIVRQIRVDSANPTAPNETYAANCAGYIKPSDLSLALSSTQSQCGSSVLADFAISPDGAFLVYAMMDGSVIAMQVGEVEALATSSSPTAAPAIAVDPPSAIPSKAPTISTTAPTKATTEKTPLPPSTTAPARAPTTGFSPPSSPTQPPAAEPTEQSTPIPSSLDNETGSSSAPTTGDFVGGISGAGLGVDQGSASLSPKNSMGGLAIGLGTVGGVLLLVVLAVLHVMRRRRKDDQVEKARLERELEIKKAWLSNKRQYEEEMRLDEEETINELTKKDTPEEVTAAAAVMTQPAKPKRTRRRFMSLRRSGFVANAKSLGSISESENEDSMMDAESGIGCELSLGPGDLGSLAPEETNGERSGVENPSKVMSQPSVDEQSLSNDEVPLSLAPSVDPPPSPKPESLHPPSLKSTESPTSMKRDNHSRWFAEILALRTSLFDSKPTKDSVVHDEDENPDDESKNSGLGAIRPLSPDSPNPIPPPPRTLPPPLDDEEPGIIPSVRRDDLPEINTFIPRVLNRPVSPSAESQFARSPSPSDLMSVDSSLYLEGSTIAGSVSPTEGSSVVSLKSLRQGHFEAAPSPLGGGASVVSITSDGSRTPTSDTPGAHYLTLGSGGRSHPGVSSLMGRSNSPDPDDMDMKNPATNMYGQADSPRSSRQTSTALYETRGGLFTGRQKAMGRLLPQYESDATASASENEADDPKKKRRANSKLALPQIMGGPGSIDPEALSGAESVASQTSANTALPTTSVWNSFLTELSKAESQFFNPTLAATNKRKSRRSTKTPSPQASTPPTANGRRKHRDQEVPTSPESTDTQPPPSGVRVGSTGTGSNRRLIV